MTRFHYLLFLICSSNYLICVFNNKPYIEDGSLKKQKNIQRYIDDKYQNNPFQYSNILGQNNEDPSLNKEAYEAVVKYEEKPIDNKFDNVINYSGDNKSQQPDHRFVEEEEGDKSLNNHQRFKILKSIHRSEVEELIKDEDNPKINYNVHIQQTEQPILNNNQNDLNIKKCLANGKWVTSQTIDISKENIFKQLKMTILKENVNKPIECSTICCQTSGCHVIGLVDGFCVQIFCGTFKCPFKTVAAINTNTPFNVHSNNTLLRGEIYNHLDLINLINNSRSKSFILFSISTDKSINEEHDGILHENNNQLSKDNKLKQEDTVPSNEELCMDINTSPCYKYLNEFSSLNDLSNKLKFFLVNTTSYETLNQQFTHYFKQLDQLFIEDGCNVSIKVLLCLMVFPVCSHTQTLPNRLLTYPTKNVEESIELCQEDCTFIKLEKCHKSMEKIGRISSLRSLVPDCSLLPLKNSVNLSKFSLNSINPSPQSPSCLSIIEYDALELVQHRNKPKFKVSSSMNNDDAISYESKFDNDKPLDGWIEADSSYFLPLNSITFKAKSNEIVSYQWSINGINPPTFQRNDQSSFEVFNLKPGNYTINVKLKTTNTNTDKQLDLSKNIQILSPNINIRVDAGPNMHVENVESIYLDGNRSIESLSPEIIDHLNYQWEHISGPQGSIIENPNSLLTKVLALKKGQHVFKLSIFDGLKTFDDTVSVYVDDKNISVPIANAGVDQTIYVTSMQPATFTLNASISSDPMNKPLQFKWIKDINNPPITEYSSINFDQPIVTLIGLKPGTYKFKLVVTNSDQMESVDHVTIFVKLDERENNFVDILLSRSITNFTENDKEQLMRRITLLLDLPENSMKFVGVSSDSNHSCRVTIFVEDSHKNIIDSMYIIKTLRHLLKSGSLAASFMITDIELNVCESTCNNHGYCDKLTKLCQCNYPWFQNPLRVYFMGKEETNCEWNQLIFTSLIMVTIVLISLISMIVCRKNLKRTKLNPKNDSKPSLKPIKKDKKKDKSYQLPHEISDFDDETIVFEKPSTPIKNDIEMINNEDTKNKWFQRPTQHADRLLRTPNKQSNPSVSFANNNCSPHKSKLSSALKLNFEHKSPDKTQIIR